MKYIIQLSSLIIVLMIGSTNCYASKKEMGFHFVNSKQESNVENQKKTGSNFALTELQKTKFGLNIIKGASDELLIEFWKKTMGLMKEEKSGNLSEEELNKKDEELEAVLFKIMSENIQPKKYNEEEAMKDFTVILKESSQEKKQGKEEDEYLFFDKIFKLPTHKAANVLRFIMFSVMKEEQNKTR